LADGSNYRPIISAPWPGNTNPIIAWDFEGESTNGTNNYWDQFPETNDGYPYLSWEDGSNVSLQKPLGSGTEISPYTIANLNNRRVAAVMVVSDNLITGAMGFTDFRFFGAEMKMTDLAFAVVDNLEKVAS